LLKITSDIFEGFDDHRATILVALDQSAAFDCVDHTTLINRMRHTFGIEDKALDWIKSYLHERSTFVRWNKALSDLSQVETGVPQGSSLGPLLFTLYIAPLSGLIRSYGVDHHQYADDTQVYIAVCKTELPNLVGVLERCVTGIHSWLLNNGLALNPTKSDVIQFVTGRGRERVPDVTSVAVSTATLQPSSTVKSLGVTLDQQLTFDQHVADVCKASYFHIRAFRHVRNSMPDDVAKTVACGIVGARLDYCNSLYAGMSVSNFNKLQRVQNTLARVVLRLGRTARSTPALKELHWLPVKYRVTYKLASLTFKIKQSGQPGYLRELLPDYKPAHDYYLRSLSKNLLNPDRFTLVLASHGFSQSSSAVWNHLTDDVRTSATIETFKHRLKTELYKAAFAS
jgi:hypothetical protein